MKKAMPYQLSIQFKSIVNITGGNLNSFHPETVLFRPGGVNLRVCLCGVRLRATP
jgi:hypothetical protein